jgi:hypothetical protein
MLLTFTEEAMAAVAARLDDFGTPAWIAVMVLAFIVWWPLGLAILAYLAWSGRMGCWGRRGHSRWHDKMERMREGARHWHGGAPWSQSSGNAAFDEYKAETLKRLEEEQKEFRSFLERLRMAKDREEFDQFMRDRRSGGGEPAPQPQG